MAQPSASRKASIRMGARPGQHHSIPTELALHDRLLASWCLSYPVLGQSVNAWDKPQDHKMPVEDTVIVSRLRALLSEVDMATTTGLRPRPAAP